MPRKKKEPWKVAVIDFETDPFQFKRDPMPFSAGFYDGENYAEFWGDDCVMQLICYIESLSGRYRIYAHNGGRFDFFYFWKYKVIHNPITIINGRIVKAGFMQKHELRDSYAIMPAPLAKIGNEKLGTKLEIDYSKLERKVREKHKKEILKYQKQDCVVLWNAVSEFIERYGPKLTVGSMAITEVSKHHTVSKQDKNHDGKFRPYYFGGRVECFEMGELEGDFKIYDVNSMYPAVMQNYNHPTGKFYVYLGADAISKFDRSTGVLRGYGGMYFMQFVGHSNKALPVRNAETGKLEFPAAYGEFYSTSHEIRAACELGLLKIDRVISVHIPCDYMSFTDFVSLGMQEKISAKERGDAISEFFAKLKLNSAYGKYGSNPENYKDWYIYDCECEEDENRDFEEWLSKNAREIDNETGAIISSGAELVEDFGRFQIWQAPSPNEHGYYDVAVAASITSAARSVLLRAIHNARRPVYCDTDSLICESLSNVIIDPKELGAWKFEGSTDKIFIAGKKLYSCTLNERDKSGGVKHKSASKGAKLSHDEIVRVTRGETVEWKSDAPNFKMTGDVKYVARNIRRHF